MARNFDFLSEQAYEDTPTFADLGLEAAVPTATTPVGAALPAGGAANAPVGKADPGYGNLTKQITDYWSQLKINPMIHNFNRAEELARLLHAQGISEYDPTKFRLKETKITDPGYSYDTESGTQYVDPQERVLKQLMYGDKAFGRIGGYGSKGEFDTRTEEYLGADDSLARSYAGKGFVDFVPVQDKQGNVIIVPKWGSSSDIDPMMMQVIGMGLNFALPGLGLGLGTIGNAALAGGITGLIGGEGDITAGLKGAALGALGGAGSQYLTPGVAGLVQDIGLTGLPADIATKALTTAGTSAARAAITGDSILDAATRGLGAGAAGAAASGAVNALELPQDLATYANPVLTAALLGQDPTQALISTAMGQATKAAGSKSLIPGGGADVIPGFFDEGGEGWLAGIEQDLQPTTTPLPKGSEDIDDLLNELYIDTASKQDQIEPTGTEVEDIERLVSEEQTQPSSYTDITDLLGAEEPSEKTAPPQVTEELPPEEVEREIDSLLARHEEKQTGTPISLGEREKFLEANIEDPADVKKIMDQAWMDDLLSQDDANINWGAVYGRQPGELDKYPTQDIKVSPENFESFDKNLQDIFENKGGFTSQWQTVGSDRVMIQDDGTAIGINTETNEPYALDEKQVQGMIDAGMLNTDKSGYYDAIGKEKPAEVKEEKKPEPKATGPSPKTETPKGTAPSKKGQPTAQSNLDLNALFAALAAMGGQQAAPEPKQELFTLNGLKDVKDIFGKNWFS